MGDCELLGSAPADMAGGTGPSVSVILPFFGDQPARIRAAAWLIRRYNARHPHWQIVMGIPYRGPWCKAAAVTEGLERAIGDILIVADADVWVDNLEDAVAELVAGAPWVIPHNLVHRLTAGATNQVLDGAPPSAALPHDESPYTGWPGGGVSVLWRHSWITAPMDPRFVGWGQEDASWALCMDTLIGKHHRLDADLWHLWHPPQDRMNRRVGNGTSEVLHRRYRRAHKRPDRMAELVAEGRVP